MTKQHKALELAAHPGTSYDAADTILALHALIVQMRDALNAGHDAASVRLSSAKEAYADYPHRWRTEKEDFDKIDTALAAADQYLGENA